MSKDEPNMEGECVACVPLTHHLFDGGLLGDGAQGEIQDCGVRLFCTRLIKHTKAQMVWLGVRTRHLAAKMACTRV